MSLSDWRSQSDKDRKGIRRESTLESQAKKCECVCERGREGGREEEGAGGSESGDRVERWGSGSGLSFLTACI